MSPIKLLAVLAAGIMVLCPFLVMILPDSAPAEAPFPIETSTTTTYSNSDIAALWVRRDGSDPGFEYPGANVSPLVGMSYFGTDCLQVSWSYNLTDIDNHALFPLGIDLYIQISYDPTYAAAVADKALTDSRIKGAYIDDFEVGRQSPANMSALYANLTHHSPFVDLTLGLIVYNRNYFIQSPYSWASIEPYFDVIHWWYYPFSYPLLYPGLAGYEDDFRTLHSWLPDKEYWLGIYLHYYNIGDYPVNFTLEQLSVAGKLMKLGLATRLSILENFWIQHNPVTSAIVRDFIDDEYQMDYTSAWTWGSASVTSTANGAPVMDDLVIGIDDYHSLISRDGFIFTSLALQNLTVHGTVTADYIIWNLRNGCYQYPYYDPIALTASYILEKDQEYRIMFFGLTDVYIEGDYYVNASEHWESKHVTINGTLNISDQLIIEYCIVDFGNNHFTNSMSNSTAPAFGIMIQNKTAAEIRVYDSIIEPVNRAFPYFFQRIVSTVGTDGNLNFIFARSIVACHTGKLRPSGYVSLIESTFFQVQPVGETVNSLIWLEAPSYIEDLNIRDCIFWNYDVYGAIGVFLMPYNLHTIDKFIFEGNSIIGGNWGLWLDFLTQILIWSSKGIPHMQHRMRISLSHSA